MPAFTERRRVVITGMGVHTALAQSIEALFAALVEGRSGVAEIVGMPIAREKRLAAQLLSTPLELPVRATRFARAAIVQALAQARLSPDDTDVSLFLATVCGDGYDLERRYRELVSSELIVDDGGRPSAEAQRGVDEPSFAGQGSAAEWQRGVVDDALRAAIFAFPLHSVADRLARELALRGLRDVNTNACASGNISIGRAMSAIRDGAIDVAVVCGTEQFRPIGYWGADRAGILGTALRPFHKARDGTVLGEGAAALVIEARDRAEARGATILAELTGYGISCSDNPHEIIPPMDGSGVARCIVEALRDAGAAPTAVDYINAHATGTLNIEIAECRGLHRAFGARIHDIPVNATKSYSGHLSAASAVLETITTVLAIERGFVHPNLGLDEPDASLDVQLVGERGLAMSPRCAVSIAMGAGGVNTAVVVEPPSEARRTPRNTQSSDELWITGLGPVTTLGLGIDDSLAGLHRAAPRAVLWGAHTSGLVAEATLRQHLAGFERYEIYNRAALLGLMATVLAARDAGLEPGLLTSQRMGLIVGTRLGGTGTWTELMCEAFERSPRHITPSVALPHGAHLCATLVSRELGVIGPTVTLTSGATAGLSGVAYAAELLRANELDAVAVCGADILDRITARSHLLTGGATALLGEGATAIVIERARSVRARGGRPIARLVATDQAFGLPPIDRADDDAVREAMVAARGEHRGPVVVFGCAPGPTQPDLAPALRALGDDLLVSHAQAVIGDAGAAGPMWALALAATAAQRGHVPVTSLDGATALRALPANARVLVPAASPGGAAACVACEPVRA